MVLNRTCHHCKWLITYKLFLQFFFLIFSFRHTRKTDHNSLYVVSMLGVGIMVVVVFGIILRRRGSENSSHDGFIQVNGGNFEYAILLKKILIFGFLKVLVFLSLLRQQSRILFHLWQETISRTRGIMTKTKIYFLKIVDL